jgi:hypothetical protein
MMHGDAITTLESAHPRADAHDCAGGFVPENPRRRHRAVLDFLDVGGTHTTRGDFHEQIARADARDRQALEAKIIGAAINYRAHHGGQRRHVTNKGQF